ncbi:hypothetical protein Btru_053651 [Bulinus truncatus]|nr:hypothetical protein Btru_053651 [Bulinus truncatus]
MDLSVDTLSVRFMSDLNRRRCRRSSGSGSYLMDVDSMHCLEASLPTPSPDGTATTLFDVVKKSGWSALGHEVSRKAKVGGRDVSPMSPTSLSPASPSSPLTARTLTSTPPSNGEENEVSSFAACDPKSTGPCSPDDSGKKQTSKPDVRDSDIHVQYSGVQKMKHHSRPSSGSGRTECDVMNEHQAAGGSGSVCFTRHQNIDHSDVSLYSCDNSSSSSVSPPGSPPSSTPSPTLPHGHMLPQHIQHYHPHIHNQYHHHSQQQHQHHLHKPHQHRLHQHPDACGNSKCNVPGARCLQSSAPQKSSHRPAQLSPKASNFSIAAILGVGHSSTSSSSSSHLRRDTRVHDTRVHDSRDDSSTEGQISPPVEREGQISPPVEREGQISPPVEREGQISPPVEREGQISPPVEREGQISPPVEREGQISPPVEREGQISPPVEREGRYLHPLREKGQISPPVEREGQIAPPVEREGQISPPVEREGQISPPVGREGQISPPGGALFIAPGG